LEHGTCNVVVSRISKREIFCPQGKFALCNKTKHDCEMRVRNMHFRAGPGAVVDFAWTDAGFLFGHVMEGTRAPSCPP
jgi:hypothetical protein